MARETCVAGGRTSHCRSDARSVNRQYREVLLTAWEATLLQRAERSARSWGFSTTGLVLRLCGWAVFLGVGVAQGSAVLTIVAAGYLATCVHSLLPTRCLRFGGPMLRWVGTPVALLRIFVVVGAWDVGVVLAAIVVVWQLAVLRTTLGRMRLRKKLPLAD